MSRKKEASNVGRFDGGMDLNAARDLRADPYEQNSLQETLEKAREIFQLCDKEEKGFITKRDMQRLRSESDLSLTPEQLEDVFDSLDQDKNGYLTPVEFSMCLGQFTGIKVVPTAENLENSRHDETFESGWSEELDMVTDQEEKRFCFMMQQLGASQIFEDQSEVRELWARLQRGKPELLVNFEHFLVKVSSHIQEMHQEKETIEQALKRKECEHDREVRCLYDEMEQQIKKEKNKLLNEDVWRHSERNHQLERELKSKEQDLESIILQQKKLEQQFEEFNSEQTDVRIQNERLRRVNDELQNQLERTRQDLEVTRCNFQILQEETRSEHHNKARDVLKVSKNMQKERESLLRQLELLRDMNRKLRDEKDAHEAKKLRSPRKKTLLKRGSVIGNYLVEDKPVKRLCSPTSVEDDGLPDEDADCGVAGLPALSSGEEDEVPLSPRGQPIGTETMESEPVSSSPDRMFKVVFIGNSGVGKSSFIHRFCYDRFIPETSATIGIDFQVKSLVVDNNRVALQLWDTAGQERFRSISKQYFRKADGVLVMYDVTSEVSFTAVRNWIANVQEGIDERAVICLLGNKTDVLNSETQGVSKVESERLAKEYNAIFYECSARSGYNIMEPMMHVARLLSEQEDKQREDALRLEDDVCDKKKGCCK
ncbi:EF-hand calcium-binding domain-containing protein 4A-like [Amblyraja radiata]|uniref:EF-hand calcium-binding domain-containing protein 4A-like n=1 Tax=Amblyraja radiata TaxID=386614 RepID=UPI001402CF75|nr:EF-hand calcium-binding domain-containing protein 4A-like [Amblyraja radiata]